MQQDSEALGTPFIGSHRIFRRKLPGDHVSEVTVYDALTAETDHRHRPTTLYTFWGTENGVEDFRDHPVHPRSCSQLSVLLTYRCRLHVLAKGGTDFPVQWMPVIIQVGLTTNSRSPCVSCNLVCVFPMPTA